MSGLWIWQGSEYARVTGFQIYHNMAEYVLIGYEYDWITEYVWIEDNRQGSEYVSHNTYSEVSLQVNEYLSRDRCI